MERITPRKPSGFIELLPADQIVFNLMLSKIRSAYELFGFAPIETPAIEFTEILLAKGGGETDKQIYRFTKGENDLSLHFDLTVPLARYVAEHYSELNFPFRRYQIQKVWRAERAQKGRFKEFYQCDIDVIGAESIIVDAEIPSVIYSVFKSLGFDSFTIRLNNRKILKGFLESLGLESQATEVLRAIDKVEKIGTSAVQDELEGFGIARFDSEKILQFVNVKGTRVEIIQKLRNLGIRGKLFLIGVEELEMVGEYISQFGVPEEYFRFDLTIARGLDYYTGTVYETVLNDNSNIGSVCSGGRYDDLIGYYSDRQLSGVGISIGLTRLFFQLKEMGLIQTLASTPSKVLVTQMDGKLLEDCLGVASHLRQNGIETEIYSREEKLAKQYKYADKAGIPYVVTIGILEKEEGRVSLKDMKTGEQKKFTLSEMVSYINQHQKKEIHHE